MPTLSQQQQRDLLKLSDQLKDPLITALRDQGALVYVVGGSVRDTLLGRGYHDIDFVVVSATGALMLSQGFTQVGRDFPVFLHPLSGAQFALARLERSFGSGHGDFSFDVESVVTLDDDLIRRDFTINAMALDGEGKLIDPYGGFADLQSRSLRHISESFSEDPLRVFRGARFLAQLSSWGFELNEGTAQIFSQMSMNGSLGNLSAERVWGETELALRAEGASEYFAVLAATSCLSPWFVELCVRTKDTASLQLHGSAPDQSHQSPINNSAQNPNQEAERCDLNPRVIHALKLARHRSKSPEVRFASVMAVLSADAPLNSGSQQPITHEHGSSPIDAAQSQIPRSPLQALFLRLKVPLSYQRLAQQLDAHLGTLMSLDDPLTAQNHQTAGRLLTLLTELGALKATAAIDTFCSAAFIAATVLSDCRPDELARNPQDLNLPVGAQQRIESAIHLLKQAAALMVDLNHATLIREQPGLFTDKTGAQIGQIIEARRLERLDNLLRSNLI